MLKNKGKGGKNRRRGKSENEAEKRELVFKEDGQEYAQVVKMLGYGRLEAMCFDGVKRLCHIPGKLRKKVWINPGDIILIGLRDYKADVILKYNPDEARNLKTCGALPEHAKINDTVNFGEEEEDDNIIEFDEFSGDEDIENVLHATIGPVKRQMTSQNKKGNKKKKPLPDRSKHQRKQGSNDQGRKESKPDQPSPLRQQDASSQPGPSRQQDTSSQPGPSRQQDASSQPGPSRQQDPSLSDNGSSKNDNRRVGQRKSAVKALRKIRRHQQTTEFELNISSPKSGGSKTMAKRRKTINVISVESSSSESSINLTSPVKKRPSRKQVPARKEILEELTLMIKKKHAVFENLQDIVLHESITEEMKKKLEFCLVALGSSNPHESMPDHLLDHQYDYRLSKPNHKLCDLTNIDVETRDKETSVYDVNCTIEKGEKDTEVSDSQNQCRDLIPSSDGTVTICSALTEQETGFGDDLRINWLLHMHRK